MKWNGPDSIYSWIVAVACCFINIIFFGFVGISGILFVASVTRFGVQRQAASFPYTLANVIRNLIGPVGGYLAFKIGIRYVTVLGIVLAAVGAGFCYLAESIQVVTILWGIVYGLGFGLGNGLLPVIINQYFEVHRTTASGISHAGGCIGHFILPSIIEVLLKNYGLSGTYLFLAGFILNCIPAALFLKKPNFQTKSFTIPRQQPDERQSLTYGSKKRLYTIENDSVSDKETDVQRTNSKIIIKEEIKNHESYTPHLTYEDGMKKVSTQTSFSNYSLRRCNSEPFDIEQIIENSKERRHVDQKIIESESLSLSFHNTDQDSGKDDVLVEKKFQPSSVHCKKTPFSFNEARVSFNDYSLYEKENDSFDKQSDKLDEVHAKKDFDFLNDPDEKSKFASEICDKHSMQSYLQCDHQNSSNISNKGYTGNFNCVPGQSGITTSAGDHRNTDKMDHYGKRESTLEKPMQLTKKSLLGSFDVILDPVFLLLALTHAVNTFTQISLLTIVVDFATDLQIESSKQKYILMSYSVAELIGNLALGWICDRGYMSITAFTAVCFAFQGLVTTIMTWSNGFISLTILMIFFGLGKAGITIVYPVAMAHFIDREKQTIALPTSSIFNAPFLFTVSPLIGYFRDKIGTYIPIFYILGILSAASCVSWMLLPCIARRRNRSTDDS